MKLVLVFIGLVIGAFFLGLIAIPSQSQSLNQGKCCYDPFNDPLICDALDAWGCLGNQTNYYNVSQYNYTTYVYSGVDDVWVNVTGDNMSGELNISANLVVNNVTTLNGISYVGHVIPQVSGDSATGGYAVGYRALSHNDFDYAKFYGGSIKILETSLILGGSYEAGEVDIVDDYGIATGGNTSSLQDTSKAWTNDEWVAETVRIKKFIDIDKRKYIETEAVIISNNATTLRYATQLFSPDSNTIYDIVDPGTRYVQTGLDGRQTNWRSYGNLYPQATNSFTLGIDGKLWSQLFIGNINMSGNLFVPTGVVIWSNGTVETGATGGYIGVNDDWVNETGDTMSGDLNITDGTNSINLSAGGDLRTETFNITNKANDNSMLFIDSTGNASWVSSNYNYTALTFDFVDNLSAAEPFGVALTALENSSSKINWNQILINYKNADYSYAKGIDVNIAWDWSKLDPFGAGVNLNYDFMNVKYSEIPTVQIAAGYTKLLNFELNRQASTTSYFAYWTNQNVSKFSVNQDGNTVIEGTCDISGTLTVGVDTDSIGLNVTKGDAHIGGNAYIGRTLQTPTHINVTNGGVLNVTSGKLYVGGNVTVATHIGDYVNISGGRFENAQQPKVRAFASSEQADLVGVGMLAGGNWTRVVLAGETFDPFSKFATNRYTPTVAGYYFVHAQVTLQEITALKAYMIDIRKNSVAVANMTFATSNIPTQHTLQISDVIYVDTDDYLELYVNSQAGVNTTDIEGEASGRQTFFEAYMLG